MHSRSSSLTESLLNWATHLRCRLTALYLLAVIANPTFGQEICRPYQATVSSGWPMAWGNTPGEACMHMHSLMPNPGIYDGGTVFAHRTYLGLLQVGPTSWYCSFHHNSVDVNGNPVPHATGQYYKEGVTGPHCQPPLRIALSGPSSTKALPAGPALPITASVTRNGAPAQGISVTIDIVGSSNGSAVGITDAGGQFRFIYTPPLLRPAREIAYGSCHGCENTAEKKITVEACDICSAAD